MECAVHSQHGLQTSRSLFLYRTNGESPWSPLVVVSAHNKRCARRSLMLGFGAGCCALRGFVALGEIDLAAEDSVVFDGEPERADIAFNHAAGA